MADGEVLPRVSIPIRATLDKLAADLEAAKARVGAAAKAMTDKVAAAGGKMEAAGKKLSIGLTAPIVAAGGLALKAALDIDDAYDNIRIGTGATGKELEGLQKSFDAVAKKTPADLGDVSAAIADLNTRLGLTGPVLETLAQQVLEAGRMGGVPVDIQKVTGAFSAFGVAGKRTTIGMDNLFQVSQATGVGINELSDRLSRQGSILRQLGFSFTQSAALVGVLDKAGIDSNAVMSSMQRSLVNLAKSGESPAVAFKRVSTEIQGYVDKGQDAKALDLAGKVFGTRGAGQFISALKSGKVNLDDIVKSAGLSGDSILKVAKDTKDFPEQFKELKNQATLALAPLGATLFPLISSAIQKVVPWLTKISKWFSGLSPQAKNVMLIVGGALAALGPVLIGVGKGMQSVSRITKGWSDAQKILNGVMNASPWVKIAMLVIALGTAIYEAYQHSETFRRIVQTAFKAVADAGRWMWENVLKPAFDGIKTAFFAVRDAAVWLYQNGIKPAFDGIVTAGEAVATAATWLWTNVLQPVFSFIGAAAGALWNSFLKPYFELIVGIFKAVGDVASWLWSTVLQPVFAAIGVAAAWLWDKIIKPYFEMWAAAFRAVGTAASWLWSNVLQPVFSAIGTAFQWLYDKVIKPVGDAIATVFSAIGSALKWVWENIIAPTLGTIIGAWNNFYANVILPVGRAISKAWTAIGDGLQWAWDHVIGPILGWIADRIKGIKDALDSLKKEGRDQQYAKGNFLGPLGTLIGIGGNAKGTAYWQGGPTVVGEDGPEIVNLPRGSSVLNNRDSMKLTAGGISEETGRALLQELRALRGDVRGVGADTAGALSGVSAGAAIRSRGARG